MDYSKKGKVRVGSSIDILERHQMIKEYLSTRQTKAQIWQKYTGQEHDHGEMLRWMRRYGYIIDKTNVKSTFTPPINYTAMSSRYDDLEKFQLQAKIKELEKQLADARLKEEGYRIMIETAEKTFNIPITKKSDTK